MDQPVAAVVGVGPGLGGAIARRFAKEGYAVALLARSAPSSHPVAETIIAAGGRALTVACDATDEASVTAAFGQIRERLGVPEVLVYNAGFFKVSAVQDLLAADFEAGWRVNCLGAFLCAQQVLDDMVAAGRGTVLLSGATASLRGSARFAALAVGKFGLRALAQSMARELGPKGVHVAHVIIDGMIDTPRVRAWQPDRAADTLLQPDHIADVYWQLHRQPPTTWTHELDLRPAVETF